MIFLANTIERFGQNKTLKEYLADFFSLRGSFFLGKWFSLKEGGYSYKSARKKGVVGPKTQVLDLFGPFYGKICGYFLLL